MSIPITQPDALGHWGRYGGRFVPETLMAPLEELTVAYGAARVDENFHRVDFAPQQPAAASRKLSSIASALSYPLEISL